MPATRLIQSMARLVELHREMLELGERKTETIVHNRVAELNQIVNKESKLIKLIADTDRERIEAVGQFLIAKGYKPNPYVTISDLSRVVTRAEDKMALLAEQAELAGVLGKLKERNALNQQLIEHSLSFIDYSLNVMTGFDDNGATYQHPGQAVPYAQRPGLFDTKA